MLNIKQKLDSKTFQLISYKDGEVRFQFVCEKAKILIGHAPHCDVVIDDPHISYYHALLQIDENGIGKILDLDSVNGITINGRKEKKLTFSSGDIISIGGIQFDVEETITHSLTPNPDQSFVEVNSNEFLEDKLPELKPKEGLVVIDGEYCDILFEEDHYEPVKILPVQETLRLVDYIDTDDLVDESRSKEAVQEGQGQALQVTVLSMGTIVSIDYLDLNNQNYQLSPFKKDKKTLILHILNTEEEIPFIDMKNEKIILHSIPEFQCFELKQCVSVEIPTTGYEIKPRDRLSFNHKTIQLIVEFGDAPPKIKSTPFFGRDLEFKKQTSKVLSILMSIALLLLLVDTTIEEPVKKLAIIYKRAMISNDKSKDITGKPSDYKMETPGNKEKKQQKNALSRAKKSQEPSKKQQSVAKKAPPKKQKAAPSKKVTKKAAKVKPYKFQLNNSMNSLLSSTSNIKETNLKTNTSSTSSEGFESSKSTGSESLQANSKVNTGTLGDDLAGGQDHSSGSQGLVSKSGIDASYLNTKTVVLGSMDPELLRKILKEYIPQFRHCYQQELQEQSEKIKGVIDLKFQITASGQVSKVNIDVKGSKFSTSGVNCMANVLQIIDFPKPKGGGYVDVKQPLNFFAQQEKI